MSQENTTTPTTYTAFESHDQVAHGPLDEVVTQVKRRMGRGSHSGILIFNDWTGKLMDFNFQGTEKEVQKRLEVFVGDVNTGDTTGPGRPKLGVVSREVSLLPRHWEWLASQPGGASATLRRLVEESKKKSAHTGLARQAQERTHKFMTAVAGDLEGFEEALRALYQGDRKKLSSQIHSWPNDIKDYVLRLSTVNS
jgi:hypothetical protein